MALYAIILTLVLVIILVIWMKYRRAEILKPSPARIQKWRESLPDDNWWDETKKSGITIVL